MIRKASAEDLPVLTDIYNQAINSRRCTGDTSCFSINERLEWFELHKSSKTPVFVYETQQEVIAYSYISLYRPGRKAFENVGEVSYYIDFRYHGKGIGSKLLEHLIIEARNIGYTHLIAILLDCNNKSVSLLTKYGFSLWGTMPEIACIDDNHYSHLYYGRSIQ